MRPAVLLSYHFWQKRDLADALGGFPERPLVFADSGAYSADSVGAVIDIDAYVEWCDRWADWIDVICTLDVIGSAEGTAVNTEHLHEHLGDRRLLPAFHVGEDFDWLRRYCETYPYVGLGGMVPWSMQPALVTRWLVRCFQIGREYGTVFHGLGQTNPRTLAALPFYSVDSSSWVSAERFGTFALWDPTRARMLQVNPARDPVAAWRHAGLFRAQGLDPAAVVDPRFGRPRETGRRARGAGRKSDDQQRSEQMAGRASSLRAWCRMQEWWAQRHGAVRLDGMPDGPLIFYVCLDERHVNTVLEVTTTPAPAVV